MDRIFIEQAQKKEEEQVYLLYRQVIAAPPLNGYSGWCEEYPTREILRKDLQEGVVLIMRDKEEVVGAVSILPGEYMDPFEVDWTEGNSCMLARLCVSPPHQKKGLGGMLAKEALFHAGQLGYASVRLLAATENHAAVRIYKKQGYHMLGTVFAYGENFYCMEASI